MVWTDKPKAEPEYTERFAEIMDRSLLTGQKIPQHLACCSEDFAVTLCLFLTTSLFEAI